MTKGVKMKVAIYARYSSANQSEKSIDDQVRVCKRYIQEHGYLLDEKYIFVDEAISGSIINRPGLLALERAAENKEIEAIVVDDLSRISRSNYQMLTLVLKFQYNQIKLISVSDGIITDDENSKLGIHIRGLMNELYLDDLRKKTMRGLEGQKLRGFSAGEWVYGYKSHPVGDLKLDKKGRPKYEGMVHKINPEEAEIVKRIYREFIEGKSITRIVIDLNRDKVATKKGFPGGWNTSTISRILKNEKYTGQWVWRKYKNVRDPMTGKVKSVPRAHNEQLVQFKEDLKIIDQETWGRAHKRWNELNGSWPVKKDGNTGIIKQKSYIHNNPTHLLAGLLRCQCCGGSVVQVSGKGSGYYGCFNARRKTCNNTLYVSRKLVEKCIIAELQNQLSNAANLFYVYKNVEKLAAKELNQVPEQITKRKSQFDKLALEIQNYLNFVKMGNFSKAVSDALKEAESKSGILKEEIESLKFQKENTFKAPPKEWVQWRLEKLHETLSNNTTASAIALKNLLGEIKLEPVSKDQSDFFHIVETGEKLFRPYYIAHMGIQPIELLDERYKGANWLQWRRK